MGTSNRRTRIVAVVAGALATTAVAAALAGASTGQFGWLHPGPAPRGWNRLATPASRGVLFYPAGWQVLPGDKGTVTAGLRDRRGAYLGYLNVTPRQGDERLHGWAAFRTQRNRSEGDRNVRALASAEGLVFSAARGSCVIDEYDSRVGSHRYREIACLVAGRRSSDVIIAAAPAAYWSRSAATLERAVSAFQQG